MLRTNLEYSNKPKISIEEEFRYLNLYLSLEQLRCGEKLTYHLTIDDDLDAEYVYLPPMLLQPYVENAIWHGIMPMPNGGTITLHAAEKTAGVLTITITDTGIGIDNSKQAKADNPSQHHSLALTLTSERLRIMTDLTKLPHTVAIRQLTAEGGTQITLQLPCDEA